MKKVKVGDSIEYLEYVWTAYDKRKCSDHVDCNIILFKRDSSAQKLKEVLFCDTIINLYSKDPKSFYYMKILPKTIRLK